jgi:hypothetical protein
MKSTDVNLIGKHVLLGSFHFSFFCFMVKVTKKEKTAVLLIYFLYKKSAFCLKMTADFLVFGHFDQKMKNEELNDPDN